MTRQPARIAIEITHDRVNAVARGGRKGLVCATRPIEQTDTAEAIKGVARDVGVTSGRAIVCFSRRDTVVKTVALPASVLPGHERPSFVRLQMDRQLPFASDQAIVDFVDAPHDPPALLAAAVRCNAIEGVLESMRNAGFKNAGVCLLDEGLARMLAVVGNDRGATLGVFVSDDVCEIVVARGGNLLMSRACELPDDADRAIEAVVTEARRTLMSYRVRPDSIEMQGAALLCDEVYETGLCGALEEALGLGAILRIETGACDKSPVSCARLAGALSLGDAHLDFASPTSPPDRFARHRQMAMLGVLIVIVLVGGWITLGLREKRALVAEVDSVSAEAGDAIKRAKGVLRTAGRLGHARAWLDAGPDWNAHVALLISRLPGNERLLLDRLSLKSECVVAYENARGKGYSNDRWRANRRVNIGIGARAIDAVVARDLREALIALDAYTLTPLGDDEAGTDGGRYPVEIGLVLTSGARTPVANEGGQDADG